MTWRQLGVDAVDVALIGLWALLASYLLWLASQFLTSWNLRNIGP